MTSPAPAERPTVSFLSDYGRADEFVGVCHAVMLRIEPSLRVVDISHDIPPHDIRAGALTLARTVQYLPDGVVLGVVDPGVGTARRAIAVEVEGGYFVGPDNGLLAPAVAMVGGAGDAVELTSERHRLTSAGSTFDGRDVFAPAAAYLASGVPLHDLGARIDPSSLQPGLIPLTHEEEGAVHGEVLWVDRFGNVQLNIGPEELAAIGVHQGGLVELRNGADRQRIRWVSAYADGREGEVVLLVDSYGLVSLATNQGSASDETKLKVARAIALAAPVSEQPADHPTERPNELES